MVPFQNLAISARSNGSVLILSILKVISGAFITIPLGSINDILVKAVRRRMCRQQLFRGRQAYLESAASKSSTAKEAAFMEGTLKTR